MKEKSALLVIDAQRVYTCRSSDLYCPDWHATIKRINHLVRTFEKKKLPIFFVRHLHKKNGSDLGRMFDFTGEASLDFNFKEGSDKVNYEKRLYLPKGFTEIIKKRYSSFVKTDLRKKLKERGVTTVAITGFMTNFCCESAAREAHDLDYFVDFVVDATGNPGTKTMSEKQIRKIIGEFLGLGFARVRLTKDLLK